MELKDNSLNENKLYAKIFDPSEYKGISKNDITFYECDYIFRCVDGDFIGKQCELKKIGNTIIIGNDKETTSFYIEDEKLSKNHCKLEYINQTFYYRLTDLNSENGTWLKISNLEEGYLIKQNTYFKLFNYLFLLKFEENNKIFIEVIEGPNKGTKLTLKNEDSINLSKNYSDLNLDLPSSSENLSYSFIRKKGKVYITCLTTEMMDEGMFFKINEPVLIRAGDFIMIGDSVFRLLSHNCGVFTEIGDRTTQEDRNCIIDDIRIFNDIIVPYYAVYDGHGGSSCSEYIRRNLHKNLQNYIKYKNLKDSPDFLIDLCKAIQDVVIYTDFEYYNYDTTSHHQGATCVFLLFIGNYILCVNLGDSVAILNKFNNQLIYLSRDLKPDKESERKRIEFRKGFVSDDGRLLGIINVSRAFGDWKFKDKKLQHLLGKNINFEEYLISHRAEFRIYKYEPKEDFYIILASDGVFQNYSAQNVFAIINDYISKNKDDKLFHLKNIPNVIDNVRAELISKCFKEKSDNMTMILLLLDN
jgi:serine/threonine protein phosphatase PrpC